MVTDGSNVGDDFAIEYSEDVMMLKTADGTVSATTLNSVLVVIKRYMSYVLLGIRANFHILEVVL